MFLVKNVEVDRGLLTRSWRGRDNSNGYDDNDDEDNDDEDDDNDDGDDDHSDCPNLGN